jgi:hypothetical protein
MRILLALCVLCLAGGCFGLTTRSDEDGDAGSSGGIVCEGDVSTIAAIDRSCETAADCVLVQHSTDCCGSHTVLGINARVAAAFAAAEAQCGPALDCNCVPQQTALEDGTFIPYGDASYAVVCRSGRCRSEYDGYTYTCLGDVVCTDAQFCRLLSDPSVGTTASCQLRGDCSGDCECLPGLSGDCTCVATDAGFMIASCFTP